MFSTHRPPFDLPFYIQILYELHQHHFELHTATICTISGSSRQHFFSGNSPTYFHHFPFLHFFLRVAFRVNRTFENFFLLNRSPIGVSFGAWRRGRRVHPAGNPGLSYGRHHLNLLHWMMVFPAKKDRPLLLSGGEGGNRITTSSS